MKTASATKIAAQFDNYLRESREQPVLVTHNGKAVAVLLAVRDRAEAEQLVTSHRRTLRSVLQEGHEQLANGRGIPEEQFWREVREARQNQRNAKRKPTRKSGNRK